MAKRRRDLQLVDLCRIDTDKFKRMTPDQLRRVENKIGRWDDFTTTETRRAMFTRVKKPETKGRHVNALVSRYVRNLRTAIEYKSTDTPGEYEKYIAAYPKEGPKFWKPNIEIKTSMLKEVDQIERQIWELQERAKCKIKPDEMVTRDVERQAETGWEKLAAKLRKRSLIR